MSILQLERRHRLSMYSDDFASIPGLIEQFDSLRLVYSPFRSSAIILVKLSTPPLPQRLSAHAGSP
jgi:hypothetical protein